MNFAALFRTVLSLVIRIVLLGLSLVFVTGLLALTLTVLVFWLLRVLWARLRGRAAPRPVFTVWRQAQQVVRTGRPFGRSPAADADVIDVTARSVDEPAAERLKPPPSH